MNRFLLLGVLVSVLPGLPLLPTHSAAAAEGRPRLVRLPQRAQQIVGFTCDVQLIDPEGFGYMPLRLEAQAVGGRFAADRTITVRVLPIEGANWPHPQTEYEVELTLRQGEASATADYFLPKYFIGSSLNVSFSEAGEPLEGYEFELSPPSSSYLVVGQSRFALILPDPQLSSGAEWERVPDMRSINMAAYPDVVFMKAATPGRLDDDAALQHLVTSSPQARQILYETETHRHWLGYESVDVILVAYGVLERMRNSDPERFEAIRRWVMCGGALWSYAAPDRNSLAGMFDVMPSADGDPRNQQAIQVAVASFDTSRAVSAFDSSLRPPPGRLWTAEEMQFIANDLQAWWARSRGLPAIPTPTHPAASIVSANDIAQRVFAQPLAAGVIVGITDADPFPGALQLWHVVRQLTGPRQVGELRYGRPVVGGTGAYWEWVLENVARPPVYAFLGVMSGFVLLVGPVSYFLTRRRGRTYLMFLIAPVLATFATLLLFGYGVLADGLGTQVRVRQITWVDRGPDGAVGGAARMTRATYFAGLRPAEGLKFSADAAVYPIVDDEEGFDGLQSAPLKLDRRIALDNQHQQFTGGFLPSRRQRQFIATRPIDEAGGIVWKPTAGGASGGPLTARNEFPFRVLRLIVRDADGNYHHSSGIPVGREVALQPLVNEGAMLRELYMGEPLEPPLGYAPSYRHRPRYGPGWDIFEGERQSLSLLPNQAWYRTGIERGLLESQLRTMLLDDRAIPNGWFVGHAELTDDASAVEGAQPVESVHFIMGRLR